MVADHQGTRDQGGVIQAGCGFDARNCVIDGMSESGHGRKTNHVGGDGSFPPKRSPDAGDGCAPTTFNRACYWWQNLVQLRTLGAANLASAMGQLQK
jgi:hypothetical protein